MAQIHLVKLSVGTESVEDLAAWQATAHAQTSDGLPRHVTRMWPKKEAELLAGGSIYWVIKGSIQARQRILRLDEVDAGDGLRRCAVVLDPQLVRTSPALKRPFQGWRYLKPEDAPRDLTAKRAADDDLPAELSAELARIGVL
ncbi:DUF1489 domain-containing protein [Pseudooceanicola sp. CBS1P-1]|uniref:DUF1489 family protein n=1 Tax=Pseudooceanicola albus TaxID=2692189 RepID=A0A6L7GAG2_9RHOB|nr:MULTISPECIES: DUF1489 domain-containing protein [Pseudooceanicola]MBT9386929.1 DUF1489 domain-containing protein [Pseudooceanicola endophyticus]MXN21035.1 DUF1489 family protein [Pseudooceanicola albus]